MIQNQEEGESGILKEEHRESTKYKMLNTKQWGGRVAWNSRDKMHPLSLRRNFNVFSFSKVLSSFTLSIFSIFADLFQNISWWLFSFLQYLANHWTKTKMVKAFWRRSIQRLHWYIYVFISTIDPSRTKECFTEINGDHTSKGHGCAPSSCCTIWMICQVCPSNRPFTEVWFLHHIYKIILQTWWEPGNS